MWGRGWIEILGGGVWKCGGVDRNVGMWYIEM
jgi:hypothetical protein